MDPGLLGEYLRRGATNKICTNSSPTEGKNIPKQQIDLNLFEEKILNILDSEALQIDKIAIEAKLSTSDCLVHLLSLEFKGMIKQLPGKMFALL